ncbi:hypothetical protein ACX0G7_09680 [Flavitalea antarctica]
MASLTESNAQRGRLLVNGHKYAGGGGAPVVVAQFNLSASTNTVSGWTNVIGNPDASVLTSSDSRGGYAVGFSTITASDAAVWNGNSGTASANVTLAGSGHVLPTGLYIAYFFNNGINYATNKQCIEINGLNTSKTYKIEILSSRQVGGTDTRTSKITCIDNAGVTDQTILSGNYNGDFNYVVTGKVPNGSGKIFFFVGPGSGFTFGYVNAIKVTQE